MLQHVTITKPTKMKAKDKAWQLYSNYFDIRNIASRVLWESYRRICVASNTHTVKTDNGYHFYYLADKSKQFKGKVIPGIDIKA